MIRNVVLPIIVCSLLLIVQACSSGHEDEVEPVVEEKGFTVKVFYINEAQPDVEIPDAGAKVYLYYGVDKEMTMLIESNFYTTRLAAGYFRDLSRPINYKCLFYP